MKPHLEREGKTNVKIRVPHIKFISFSTLAQIVQIYLFQEKERKKMLQNNPVVLISSIVNLLISQFGHQFPGNSFVQRVLPIYTRQLGNCLSGNVYSDPSLGSFPAISDQSCGSSPCVPESPDVIGIKFILSKSSGQDYYLTHGDEVSKKLVADSKMIVFGVHGWIENYKMDPEINETRDGWIKQGVDFVTVDWSGGNINFESAASNTRIVGAKVGQLIDYLGVQDKAECLGFSFGAHACGFAGQWLRERGKLLASCTGLDPASRNFEGCSASNRLDPSDCGVVKVVHSTYTDKGAILKSFGITEKSGTCDYFINYDRMEPNCPDIPLRNMVSFISGLRTDQIVILMEKLMACNHLGARKVYNKQLHSMAGERLSAQICPLVMNSCGSKQDGDASKLVSIPPFDDCTSKDYFNACTCLST